MRSCTLFTYTDLLTLRKFYMFVKSVPGVFSGHVNANLHPTVSLNLFRSDAHLLLHTCICKFSPSVLFFCEHSANLHTYVNELIIIVSLSSKGNKDVGSANELYQVIVSYYFKVNNIDFNVNNLDQRRVI